MQNIIFCISLSCKTKTKIKSDYH